MYPIVPIVAFNPFFVIEFQFSLYIERINARYLIQFHFKVVEWMVKITRGKVSRGRIFAEIKRHFRIVSEIIEMDVATLATALLNVRLCVSSVNGRSAS